MLTSYSKREIRHFDVVVVQGRQRNVQKSVMHVQSCKPKHIGFLPFSLPLPSPSSMLKLPFIGTETPQHDRKVVAGSFQCKLVFCLKEQYPVTAHAPNFEFWTGCREIKRCEESKRTLKNPFASRLTGFNTTLKLLRITDQ